jgi:hypothetical protein
MYNPRDLKFNDLEFIWRIQMKISHRLLLSAMMALLFLAGYSFRSAIAQRAPAATPAQGAEKLPPDIFPETLNRAPKVTRDDFTTDEDKAAFDRAVGNNTNGFGGGWNGIRLRIPIVMSAYRTAIQTLDKEDDGGMSHYQQLAMLIGAREADDELDWNNHEKMSEKVIPHEVVEVLRNHKDTKGLEEKDAVMIQFGREMFEQRKVSSKTFGDLERLFTRRKAYAIIQTMIFFNGSGNLLHAYDQRLAPGEKHPFADTN